MTIDDKVLAKRAIDAGRLTVDQAKDLLMEAGRSKRSFTHVAVGRGLLSPQDLQAPAAKPPPTAQILLLFVGLMVLMGLAILATKHAQDGRTPPVSHERR